MMQNNTNNKVSRTEGIMNLRNRIYMLESMNIRKKVPQNDSEMVEKLIKEIKRSAEKEEVK